MARSLQLRTFQIGAPPKRGEGLRIGAARHPPRGVAKSRWREDGFFDVWLPVIAPSAALIHRYRKDLGDAAIRKRFFQAYEREMQQPAPRHVIELLAALAERTPIAVGCFCDDESHCHRSRLVELIRRVHVS